MTEDEARAVQTQVEQARPTLICELRPRIHTGQDPTAVDPDDAWVVVVTNAATGVVVNLTDAAAWREQLQPALPTAG